METKISAQVLADSINFKSNRITTLSLTLPHYLLAELIACKMLTVTVVNDEKQSFVELIKNVESNPFIPIAWKKDSDEYLEGIMSEVANDEWLCARREAVRAAKILNIEEFVAKQLCKHLLEPFMYINVIVTATEWEEFFNLKCPKYYFEPSNKYFRSRKDFLKEWNGTFKVGLDISREATVGSWSFEQWQEKFNHSQADIHMQVLAESIWDAMNENEPRDIKSIDIDNWRHYPVNDDTVFEHSAYPMDDDEYYSYVKGVADFHDDGSIAGFNDNSYGWFKNFKGWIPYGHYNIN